MMMLLSLDGEIAPAQAQPVTILEIQMARPAASLRDAQ